MEPTTPPPASALPPDATVTAPAASWPKEPRRLAAGRATSWWGEGWKIFTVAPLVWIGIVVAMIAIHLVLSWIPVLGGVVSTVIYPILVGGVLLGVHGMAQGRPLEFMTLFAAFRSDRAKPLAMLGLITLGVIVVVALVFMMIMMAFGFTAMVGGAMGQGSSAALGAAMAGMGVGAAILTLLGIVTGILFAMAWWFATALVTLNHAQPVEALKASFNASIANLGAILLFVLLFVVFAIVASIPFALGWLVLGPVALASTYASWREVFGD